MKKNVRRVLAILMVVMLTTTLNGFTVLADEAAAAAAESNVPAANAEEESKKDEEEPKAKAEAEATASKAESTASKAESAASKAESAASKAENAASKAESAASKAETAASKAETAASKAETASSESESAASEAAAVTPKTESAASDAAPVTSETKSAASEAASVTPETESAASEAAAVTSETESAASEAESVTSEAESVTPEAESVTSEAESAAPATESVTSEAESVTSETESVTSEAESVTSEAESTESEAEEVRTRTAYEYEDSNISVKAKLAKADAVPDDAVLSVKRVSSSTKGYNYDAYMDALNASSSEQEYTDDNTLLYDIGFIVDEKDADGKATGNKVEYEPESGSVSVSVKFKKSQLSDGIGAEKNSDVEIKHLPLVDSVKNKVDTTADATDISKKQIKVEGVESAKVSVKNESASFKTDSFSVYALVSASGTTKELVWGGTIGSLVSTRDILGDAWEYGITANSWTFNGEAETSFAVKNFYSNGGQTGVTDKAIGSNHSYYLVGNATGTTMIKGVSATMTLPEGVSEHFTDSTSGTVSFVYADRDSINSSISKMISGTKANALLSRDSVGNYNTNIPDVSGQMTIDITGNQGGTYYIDVDKYLVNGAHWDAEANAWKESGSYNPLYNALQSASGLTIKKNSNQKIVFNFSSRKSISINKFDVVNDGKNYTMDEICNMSTGRNPLSEDFIFNAPNASSVTLNTVAGIFLFPNASVNWNGVAGGWLVADTVTGNAEWHFLNGHLSDTYGDAPVELSAVKNVNGEAAAVNGFSFKLEEKKDGAWEELQTVENSGSDVKFDTFTYARTGADDKSNVGDHVFRISEAASQSVGGVQYTADVTEYYAVVSIAEDNAATSEGYRYGLKVNSVKYYSDEALTKEVEGAVFNNRAASGSVSLTARKTLTGGTLAADEFSFTLKSADGTVLQTKKNAADGTITFDPIAYTLSDVGTKAYTISEVIPDGAVKDSNGNYKLGDVTYDGSEKKVTVTVSDNGSGTLAVTSSGDGAAAAFANSISTTSSETTSSETTSSETTSSETTSSEETAISVAIEKVSYFTFNGTSEKSYVEGAELELYRNSVADSNLVTSWTTTNGTKVLTKADGLAAGETYVLHEASTPSGNDWYVPAEDITFTVSDSGAVVVKGKTVKTVSMEDGLTTSGKKEFTRRHSGTNGGTNYNESENSSTTSNTRRHAGTSSSTTKTSSKTTTKTVKAKTVKAKTVKTGDDRSRAVPIAAGLAAIAVILYILVGDKRRRAKR